MNTISVTFDLKITPQQIYDFRGAIIDFVGLENDLFHNRELLPEGALGNPMQRYPKIQYRFQDGNAALWGINEGAEALKKMLTKNLNDFEMYGVQTPLRIYQKIEDKNIQTSVGERYSYRLRHFIPLNEENDKKWQAADSYHDKISLLEQIILNELVLFSYAAQWQLPETPKLSVSIKDILHQSTAHFKTRNEQNRFVNKYAKSFDIIFQTNALLPEGIGLGRHKAYGYGIVSSIV